MSEDASFFLALLARSRIEQAPDRRVNKRRASRAPRHFGLVPATMRSGVSRVDIRDRMRTWGVDWTLERVTTVVEELVPTGELARGSRGIYAPGA